MALRDVIYLALEQNGRFVLDSSSLLVDGRGVILAADRMQNLRDLSGKANWKNLERFCEYYRNL